MSIIISGTTGIDAGSLPVNNCGNTEVEGNLNLSGVGARITGDFSNGSWANRLSIQNSTSNTVTSVHVLPNGTATATSLRVFNSSNPDNSSFNELTCTETDSRIVSGARGTGTAVPLTIHTNGSERMRIDTAGNVGIGTSSPAYKLDINNAISRIGDSSGIGFLQFGSSATASSNYHIGDNAGNFIFYQGNYGSGTERMRIDSAGRVTMPYQPAFHAIGNTGRTTIANGGQFMLGVTTSNIGNCYSTSTGRFTAPIAGYYVFQYGIYSYVTGQLAIKKNGGDWSPSDTSGLCTVLNDTINSASMGMYLNSGDYVSFGFRNGASGDVYTSHAWLSGHLVG